MTINDPVVVTLISIVGAALIAIFFEMRGTRLRQTNELNSIKDRLIVIETLLGIHGIAITLPTTSAASEKKGQHNA